MIKAVYLTLTLGRAMQTLGEEYTDILPRTSRSARLSRLAGHQISDAASLTDIAATHHYYLIPTGSNGFDDVHHHQQHSRGEQSHYRSIQISGSSCKLA